MIPKKSLDSVLDQSIILTKTAPNDNAKQFQYSVGRGHRGKDIDFKSCSSRVAADWVKEPQGICTSNRWTMYSFCTWYDKIDLTLYPYEKKIGIYVENYSKLEVKMAPPCSQHKFNPLH